MREEGLTLVPPYDHPLIIAGQGTVGLEIAADLPNVDTVLVPVGGGGFSAGVASAIKLRLPNARVIGVEPTGAPKLTRARAAGRPVQLEHTGGLADGLLAVRDRQTSRSRTTSGTSTTSCSSTTTRFAARCACCSTE